MPEPSTTTGGVVSDAPTHSLCEQELELRDLAVEVIEKLSTETDRKVRPYRHYSGKYMFGRECVALIHDGELSPVNVGVKLARLVMELERDPGTTEDLIDRFSHSQSDRLGLSQLIYFPHINDPGMEVNS